MLLFGLGDFSRTFLIVLAARVVGEHGGATGVLSTAVLLYAGHNLISALAAYPAGKLGDARSRSKVLVAGMRSAWRRTPTMLAFESGSFPWLVVAIARRLRPIAPRAELIAGSTTPVCLPNPAAPSARPNPQLRAAQLRDVLVDRGQ